jgi:hypothetical protein
VEGRKGRTPYGQEEFEKIIANYDALLEPSFLHRDLIRSYPDAKFVLATKSVKSWLASMRDTIFTVVHVDPGFSAVWWDYVRFVMWIVCEDTWTEGTPVSAEAEKNAVETYEAHHEDVRSLVPEERLLEWNPGEGWRPLCDFLEVPAPFVKEFPQVNDVDDFVEFHRRWFVDLKRQCAGMEGSG